MQTREIDIKKFHDYRAFLEAHIQSKQKVNSGFSFGMWAKNLGLKSTSSITKVMQGDREPGENITNSLINYFKFNKKDEQYFRDLVRLKKIKNDPRLKVLLLERIGKINPGGESKTLDHDTFKLISKWQHFAIREMSRIKNFKLNFKWIASKLLFKTNINEVRECISNLEKVGLVKIEDGSFRLTTNTPHTENDISDEAIKLYHESMLENAKLSLRTVDVKDREITAETLSFNKDKLPEAKELIRQFKEKFANLMDVDSGDEVYQMQIQFFPLTNISGDKNENN